MIDKIAMIFLGVIITLTAVASLISSNPLGYRDFPVPLWVYYLMLPLGLITLTVGIRSKPDRSSDEAALCPNCGSAHKAKLIGKPCPHCGTTLESIEGFYERHPQHDNDTIPSRDEVFKDE